MFMAMCWVWGGVTFGGEDGGMFFRRPKPDTAISREAAAADRAEDGANEAEEANDSLQGASGCVGVP